jgi:signal transduction histidine kinase
VGGTETSGTTDQTLQPPQTHARAVDKTAAQRSESIPLAILLVVVAVVLGVATVIPGINFDAVAPLADNLVSSAALVASGTIALLAWIRYRETAEVDALLQAAAFLTLFLGAALRLAVLAGEPILYDGFDRANPGQGPMYAWSLQRVVAALLLLLGARAALNRTRAPAPRQGLLVVLGVSFAVLGLSVAALAAEPYLPQLVPTDQLHRMLTPGDGSNLADIAVGHALIQLAIAAIYLFAAAAYASLWARLDHRAYTAFLSVALVVAAFAQANYAIVPGAYDELLTTGDVLRLLFYVLVVMGVAAATRGDLRALRGANRQLELLRESDARRATMEERARMAREVHDGLVQELWLARLTGGRLTTLPDLPAEAKEIATRLDAVLDSALGEARQAIATLQPSADTSFGALFERFVEDYADRFRIEVMCTVEGDLSPLPPDSQGDLLRICREALTNARKHADASVVDVRLEGADGRVRLTVQDDGAGFDPSVGRGGYGMQTMRQRAERIGARLDVTSTPGSGTLVSAQIGSESGAAQ